MRNYFNALFFLSILIVSCNNNSDYKRLIFKIESENLLKDLKEFNFRQRGEHNWVLYNKSIQFVYHKSNSQNYLFSSTNNPAFDSLGKIYFPIVNTPQKIYFYRSGDKYSAKRIYIISQNIKSDSIPIQGNDYLASLFSKANAYYNLSKDYKLRVFIYHKNQDVYEFILNPDKRLFYAEDLKQLSRDYKELFEKGSQLNDKWFVVEFTK